MKNLLKIGLWAITAGILATGLFGCGDGDRGLPHGSSDTTTGVVDSPKKTMNTTKPKIDNAKKDSVKN